MTGGFFFDNNVAPRLAELVRVFDRNSTIIHIRDQFAPDTPDETWLRDLAGRSPPPAVVSGDAGIVRSKAQAQVLRGLPLTFFFLAEGWINIPWEQQALKIIGVWPAIAQAASHARQPTVFKVPITARKVEQISVTSQLGR